jgi:uncharacterized protein YraI
MTGSIRNTLLAGSATLLLSAGAAAAAPATVQSDLNVRSGPVAQYQVIGTVQGGETVDVAGCTGRWCQISFSGGTGYANQNYLAMAGGGGPGYAAVAPGYADPGYAYDETPDYAYNDYYYDDYGPSVGFSVSPGFRHRRHGWDGRWNGGGRVGSNWQGRPGWNGGNWQGRPGWNGGNRVGGVGAPAGRVGSVGTGFSRGGVGAPASQPGSVSPQMRVGGAGAQVSAPTGMRAGGVGAPGGGVGAPAGGGARGVGGAGGGGAHGGVGAPQH